MFISPLSVQAAKWAVRWTIMQNDLESTLSLLTSFTQLKNVNSYDLYANLLKFSFKIPTAASSKPLWSHDTSPCEFYLWGKLKAQIYTNNPSTLKGLQQNIESVFAAVPQAELLHMSLSLKKTNTALHWSRRWQFPALSVMGNSSVN